MSAIHLAECIRLAANIRETSYDLLKEQEWKPGTIPVSAPDFYRKTLWQSCAEAEASCADYTNLGQPAFMLLNSNWNEALAWASNVINVPSQTA